MPEATEHTSISILFWNLHKNDETYPLIGQAIEEYGVDICVFAEAPCNIEFHLEDYLPEGFKMHPLGYDNPKIKYAHSPRISLSTLGEDPTRRGSIIKIQINNVHLLNLVGCHLVDSSHNDPPKKLVLAVKFAEYIAKIETETCCYKTIVIGDFNMNPFEPGMVQPEAFNAVMNKQDARPEGCKDQFVMYQYFYNPMWYYLGHPELINGTFYRAPYYWNVYDQVLVRPELIDGISHEDIKIMTKIKDRSLLTKYGHIDNAISDHLPILIKIKI